MQISFDFDSASLRADQKPKLAALCQAMKSVDAALYQIIGHTDSSGSAAYNQRLSLLRAQEVKRHMVSECGIPENRLEAVGLGESAPFDQADPKADVNRRVEFQALG
ncbi:OmpA family protein [Seohaeicola zhoushanensis]